MTFNLLQWEEKDWHRHSFNAAPSKERVLHTERTAGVHSGNVVLAPAPESNKSEPTSRAHLSPRDKLHVTPHPGDAPGRKPRTSAGCSRACLHHRPQLKVDGTAADSKRRFSGTREMSDRPTD